VAVGVAAGGVCAQGGDRGPVGAPDGLEDAHREPKQFVVVRPLRHWLDRGHAGGGIGESLGVNVRHLFVGYCEMTVTLAGQLHPDRFSAMSDKMAAIVGFILGDSWTEPEIAALSVTSDGFVLTDADFFGEAADLDRDLLNLLVAAEVTPEERAAFGRL
jgi:hypothetical protein